MILERLHPDVVGVGGPVTGADPITGAIVTHSFLMDGHYTALWFVRSQKDTGQEIRSIGLACPTARRSAC